ncbi:MAG: peptidoglycan DD-metalloendopeptidase family protein [Bacteroidaceae bacterium]|nr:peptidoglycan DD-metalloendopeptidase family protein [Bacteroidaceae bacterium]
MSQLKTIKKLALTVITAAITATNASAQDVMAALAPSDVKMKAIDTLMLHNIRNRENTSSPATSLYEEWSNKRVAGYTQEIPETFTVDLRHYSMPTTSRVVTSNYGRRWGRMHKGIDLKVYTGDTIVSAFDGKVRIVAYEGKGYGNYVVIRHNNGLETVYGHLSKHLVIENQRVKAGQPIGLGGNTGRSTGSHLHFETRLLGIAINPAFMFDFVNQDVKADRYIFRRSEHVAQSGSNTYQQPRRQATLTETAKTIARQAPAQPVQAPEAPVASNHANSEAPLPAASGDALSNGSYRVKAGDTLFSIARRFGMNVDELCRKNGFPTSHSLRTGEVLIVKF